MSNQASFVTRISPALVLPAPCACAAALDLTDVLIEAQSRVLAILTAADDYEAMRDFGNRWYLSTDDIDRLLLAQDFLSRGA